MSGRAGMTSPRLLVQCAQAHAAEAHGHAEGRPAVNALDMGTPPNMERTIAAAAAAVTTGLCAVAMAIAERTSYELDRESRRG